MTACSCNFKELHDAQDGVTIKALLLLKTRKFSYGVGRAVNSFVIMARSYLAVMTSMGFFAASKTARSIFLARACGRDFAVHCIFNLFSAKSALHQCV